MCVGMQEREILCAYREHIRVFLPIIEPFLNNQPGPSPENTEIQRVKVLLGRTSQSDVGAKYPDG